MRYFKLLVAAGLFFLLAGCGKAGAATPTPGLPPALAGTPLPRAMKGYELYSWQTGASWSYTLITGTNRNKTLDEITSGENTITDDGWVKITVQGASALKTVLDQLPGGESVFWIVTPASLQQGGIRLPPQEIVDDLQAYCQKLGLSLYVPRPL